MSEHRKGGGFRVFIRSVIMGRPKMTLTQPAVRNRCALSRSSSKRPIGIDVQVEQWRTAHACLPTTAGLPRPGQFKDRLHHAGVDVDKRSLDELQRQRRNFLISDPVGCDLAALPEEHEAIRAVPVLDHVQAFVDLAAEALEPEIAAEEDRLDVL